MLRLISSAAGAKAAGPLAALALAILAALGGVILALYAQTRVQAAQVETLSGRVADLTVKLAVAHASGQELRGQIEDQNAQVRAIAADCRASSAEAAARGVAAWQAARTRSQAHNIGAGPQEMNRWLASSP